MRLTDTPLQRDVNNTDTLERAQVTIDALAEANDEQDLRDLEQSAQGWITALWIERLIDRAEHDRLLTALAVARQAWQAPIDPPDGR